MQSFLLFGQRSALSNLPQKVVACPRLSARFDPALSAELRVSLLRSTLALTHKKFAWGFAPVKGKGKKG